MFVIPRSKTQRKIKTSLTCRHISEDLHYLGTSVCVTLSPLHVHMFSSSIITQNSVEPLLFDKLYNCM